MAFKDKEKKRKEMDRELNKQNPDTNPDPITGEKGAHPIGTGLGAAAVGAGGAAAGAAAGAAIGAGMTGPAAPIGGVIGAIAGAVAGGYAGKGVAEKVNPTEHDNYWRDNYRDRPYVQEGATYDEYGPAYRYGVQARAEHPDQQFEDVEQDLQRDWETRRGSSNLSWPEARDACRDAWDRCCIQGEQSGEQPGQQDRL